MRAESGSAKRTLKLRTSRPDGRSNTPIRAAPSELYALVPSGEIAALSPMGNCAERPGIAKFPTLDAAREVPDLDVVRPARVFD
jgi:hypothetical protein